MLEPKKLEFPNYPQVSKKNFTNWNEDMFIRYNNERIYNHPNFIIRFIEKQRVNILLKNLNSQKSDIVLAAGCGEGYIENQIKNYKKLYLIDLSETALKKAKLKLKNKRNLAFLKGNLEDLPFPNKKFDKVECSEVIEHVLLPEKMISEFHRVIKPNGLLVISFPNEPLINYLKNILIKINLFGYFFPNIPVNMLEEWHIRSMDYNRFKEIINNDWQVVNVSGAPFNFFPIRYIVTVKPR